MLRTTEYSGQRFERSFQERSGIVEDATLRQGNQIYDLILQANDSKGLAQYLISNWGSVTTLWRNQIDQATLLDAIKDLANPYIDERRLAARSIRSDYKWTEPDEALERVIHWLKQQGFADHFDPNRLSENVAKLPEVPGTHGICVVPKPSILGPLLSIEDPLANFGLLTKKGPLAAIASQRNLKNRREDQMGSGHFDIEDAARDAILELEENQPGGFIAFRINSGWVVNGYCLSPRNARWEVKKARDPRMFPVPAGLGLWDDYVNPNRVGSNDDLFKDFIGDKIRLEPDKPFDLCSCLHFFGGKLHFDGRWIDLARGHFAPVVGFLP